MKTFKRIGLGLLQRFKDSVLGIFLSFLNEEKKFKTIYKTGYWKSIQESDSSFSGSGSSINATNNLRRELPKFIDNYNVKSLLDIPCGDFYWLSKLNLPIKYIGADLVSEIIIENTRKYGGENRQFERMDITKDSLPSVDFVMVRDCLVHLKNDQIISSLKNIILSESKYVGITNFEDCTDNRNPQFRDRWRPINLNLAPFNFPKPLVILDDSYSDNKIDTYKTLSIWQVKDLKKLFLV